MKPEDWSLLEDNFEKLLELEGDDLDKAILQLCTGNSELANEMQNLLAAHKKAGEFLSTPAIRPAEIFAPQPLFQHAELVAGRFRIVRFIAEGGIGQVFEAEDLVLEERIALKAILSPAGIESAWALLKQEIQSARRVTHQNVCRIHDVVEHGGLMLMTMELLEGPTLSQHLKEHGPMSRRIAMQLIQQMAAGLQSAHDSGVIHRDFKPGNVMLTPGPNGFRIKITDFGLASPIGLSPKQLFSRAGTPGYMAPEQAMGGQLGTATDVYALGAVIRDMIGAGWIEPTLTSTAPGIRQSPARSYQRRLGPWKHVVERCLAEDPTKRYQHPADVAAALQRIQRRKHLALAAVAGSLVLLLAILFFWQRFQVSPAGPVIRLIPVDILSSVSPDGKWGAGMDLKSGGLTLFDFRASPIRSSQLAGGGKWPYRPYPGPPLFSRDSRKIAYAWFENDRMEIHILDIDGRHKDRSLISFPGSRFALPQDWFPDDSRILIKWAEPGPRGPRMHLAFIGAATGSLENVIENADGLGKAMITSDSTEIWFDMSEGPAKEGSGIFALKLSNGSKRVLIDDGFDNSLAGISADHRNMVFLSNHGHQNGLWTMRLKNGIPDGPAVLASGDMGNMRAIGMTRDGALYYNQVLPLRAVYTARLDIQAGKLTRTPRSAAPRLDKLQSGPSWSGNGRLLFNAASIFKGKILQTLFILEPNGSIRELSPELDSYSNLHWRIDGSIGGIGNRKGIAGYYKIDAVTGKAELLTRPQSIPPELQSGGTWSRDGDTWYNWESEESKLVRYDLHTGTHRILCALNPGMKVDGVKFTSERDPVFPVVSPDGQTLAFISVTAPLNKRALTLISTTGGQPRYLWIPPWPLFNFAALGWMPDSRSLIIGLSRGDIYELWRVSIGGASPTKIEFPSLPNLSDIRVHPDGKTIAFCSGPERKEPEIKVIENFLPRH